MSICGRTVFTVVVGSGLQDRRSVVGFVLEMVMYESRSILITSDSRQENPPSFTDWEGRLTELASVTVLNVKTSNLAR